MPDTPEKNTYAISTGNVLDPKEKFQTARLVCKPSSWHQRIATEAGYDGYELWSTRPRLAFELASNRLDGEPLSVAQSPRAASLTDALIHLNPRELAEVALLPHFEATDYLSKARQSIGDVPVVGYAQMASHLEGLGFSQRLVQPTAQEYFDVRAKSVYDYLEGQRDRKVSGICFDTNNFRRPHNKQRSPFLDASGGWVRSVKEFFQSGEEKPLSVMELQVSIGRRDLPWHDIATTDRELADLVYDRRVTDIKHILREVARFWRGYVVVELMPSAVRSVMDVRTSEIPDIVWIEMYRQVLGSIKRCFDEP